MKDAFNKYLTSVRLPEPYKARVEAIFDFYQGVSHEELLDIFISEYIKDDGTREFESLWFFSENNFAEAKQFLTTDNFDMTPLKSHVQYWRIEKQDYDFRNATEKSRILLTVRLDVDMGGTLKASQENCDHLRALFLKYISPNLKP
jgi:hypothetical protein